jgi:hypothetical protein
MEASVPRTFEITGLNKGNLCGDRSSVTIDFQIGGDSLVLKMKAAHLDHLITMLIDLEYLNALHDPARGPHVNEVRSIRVEVADSATPGQTLINGEPHTFMRFRIGKIERTIALSSAKALELAEQLQVAPAPTLRAQ